VGGLGRVAASLCTSAAGQLGSPRGAIGLRLIKLVGRGSAAGQRGAPRDAIGFRSKQLAVRGAVYSSVSQASALRTSAAVLLQPGCRCPSVRLRVQSA